MNSPRKTTSAATKQIHVSPQTYRMLKHVAIDRDIRLLELAEQVIEAGVRVVIPEHQPAQAN